MNSYNYLDIYKLAYKQAIKVHFKSLTLPKHELYEQGSQLRRTIKTIKDTIAEAYGRRRYKAGFIKNLIFAQSSCDEATSQLNMISNIHFPENPLTELLDKYIVLDKKIINLLNRLKKTGNGN
jgi:four helix bundle protein